MPEGFPDNVSDDDLESPFASELEGPPSRYGDALAAPWKIAIVDDEQEVHDVTVLALRSFSFCDRGLEFLSARSAAEARQLLAQHADVALVLLDVVMETDEAGLALVRYIRESLKNEHVRVVLRTGQPGHAPETAVIRDFDISDYRTKTELTATRLLTTVTSALRTYQQLQAVTAQREELARLYAEQKAAYDEIARLKSALERERDYLREEVKEAGGGGQIVGSSPALQRMMAQVEAVAPTDATVLLLGESGVGKELVARAIHEKSGRRAAALVKVNCASVPRELFESEFFGHVKGSFTGAHRDRVGRFQLADGGTLFLDEVGEIPLELQGKLLRVLQERRFERVGDDHTRSVDVRLIAATNRSLVNDVAEGRFRGDLFYRLSVVPVHVPPLRERREDILPLARQFLENSARRLNLRVPDLSADDESALGAYSFPGNIRELGNLIERAVVLHRPGEPRLHLYLPDQNRHSEIEELTPPLDPGPPSSTSSVIDASKWKELERENIENALLQTGWKVSGARGAAALLGIKPSTLSYRMKTLGIVRR